MSDFFRAQRRARGRPAGRPPRQPEAEPFQPGPIPAWAVQGTAAYTAIERALDGIDRTPPVVIQPATGKALPKRTDQLGRWKSQRGEPLAPGDEVALSLLEHPGAKGRLIGDTDEDAGKVECELTACGSSAFCDAIGKRLHVDAEHILMLIRKGG